MNELQEQVVDVIEGLVASGAENGVQAAVYQHGELIVDAVAGVADHRTGRPVTSDTLFYAASTVKGVTSTVVHVLVEEGVLSYDTLVASVWPEFGVHGKASTMVRQVLTHSAGVPGLPADLTLEQFCDWDSMCSLIASLEPWWEPGSRVGYHAVTFGFILGEVVRRVCGSPISAVLASRVGERLGIAGELYFGVPASELDRVAHFEDDPAGAAMFASLPPDFPLFKSGPRSLFPNAALANNVNVTMADIPAWGTVSARALARMYAALMDEVDGVRLVSPDRLRELSALSTTGLDEMTGGPAQYGLGYTVGQVGMRPVAPTVFGMVGIGGSAAYADTATGISVAVTKNRFNPTEINAFDQIWDLAQKTLS